MKQISIDDSRLTVDAFLLLNIDMSKTQKELAFLRDLYIGPDWTRRFTELFDKKFRFADDKEILYVNGGTGIHPLELFERLSIDSRLDAYSEDEESNILAQAKADIVGAKINFSDEFPRQTYDLVIADASFVRPVSLAEFLEEIIDMSDKRVAFFLPTAGSFGEIFSMLWESFLNAGLSDKASEVEGLITEIPLVSRVEEIAGALGLSGMKAVTEREVFEFENSTVFIESPLIADFLFPAWLGFLDEEENERIRAALARTIDDYAEDLTFRFRVKATLVTGEKR